MSIFPTITQDREVQIEQQAALTEFVEYAYDFKKNALLLKDGRSYLVFKNTALKIWIFKVLHTQRFLHVAYSRAYGCELNGLLGQPIQTDILLPEIQRFIVEALMVNPYLRKLQNFVFSVDGEKVQVTFQCVSVYGEFENEFIYKGG